MASCNKKNVDSSPVGPTLERKNQLSAQRKNEEHWKQDSLEKNAESFKRDIDNAETHSKWERGRLLRAKFEESRLPERLLAKRLKLQRVLQEEEERYKRQLEELKKREKEIEEDTSPEGEELRRKLRETRAEANLYGPRVCKKCEHCFTLLSPGQRLHECLGPVKRNTFATSKQSPFQNSNDPNAIKPLSELNSNQVKSPSKEVEEDEDYYYSSSEEDVVDIMSILKNGESIDKYVKPVPYRYRSRYAHRSMANTNIDAIDDSIFAIPKNEEEARQLEKEFLEVVESSICDTKYKKRRSKKKDQVVPTPVEVEPSKEDPTDSKENEDPEPKDDASAPAKSIEDASNLAESVEDADTEAKDVQDASILAKNTKDANTLRKTDHRRFESEKSMPWLRMDPQVKNHSEEMFMYLSHKDMKSQIEDISRRELQACTRRNWGEALRLRDMGNKLELLREQKLYNMKILNIDEDTRKSGLENIERRRLELEKREQVCTDSNLYSEEAKKLWQQWVEEDKQSAIKYSENERESLMKSLEKEWQNLAIEDKKKIYDSSHGIVSDSFLQKEHQLAAEVLASKSKSTPDSTA